MNTYTFKVKACHILVKFASKLKYLSRRQYLQLCKLYPLALQNWDWDATLRLFHDFFTPQQWEIIETLMREWLFGEIALKRHLIDQEQARDCMKKKFEYLQNGKRQVNCCWKVKEF